MKTIHNFCQANQLEAVKISYTAQGVTIKRKGIDLIEPQTRCIVASIKPVDHATVKWEVVTYPGHRCIHASRITKAILQAINPTPDTTGMYLKLKE